MSEVKGRLWEKLLSSALLLLVVFQLYQSTKVATTPRGTPAREALQQGHYSIGLLALLVVLPRLYLWWKNPRPEPQPNMPFSADAFAREICFLIIFTVFAFTFTGPIFAWAEGHHVSFFGLAIPSLAEPSYQRQTLFGFLHSAIGMWIFGIVGLAVLVSVYQRIRYGAPLFRMLPWTNWSSGRGA